MPVTVEIAVATGAPGERSDARLAGADEAAMANGAINATSTAASSNPEARRFMAKTYWVAAS